MGGRSSIGAALTGAIFLTLGVLFFLDQVDALQLRVDVAVPVLLIALGLAVIAGAAGGRGGGSAG